MIDLRLIATFIQAARLESFTAAARALGVSPGAVSHNIKALEEQLRTRLFQRTSRQVKLTPEGQRYLQRCGPAIEALSHAADDLAADRDAFRGILRISSTTGFGRAHVLPLAVAFQKRHPELEIEVSLSDQFVDLVAEEFDLAIRGGILPENEYISRLILPVTPLVCASPAYFAEHGMPNNLQALTDHRLVGMRSNPSQRVFAWEFAAPKTIERLEIAPAFVVNDPEGAALAAVSGAGVAQVGSNIVLPMVADGRLELALTDRAAQTRGLYAVYPSRRFASSKLKAFIQFLAEAFAQRPDLVFRPSGDA
jgi:LysR family transcriptional regulator, regulator for bpeEF and oprC